MNAVFSFLLAINFNTFNYVNKTAKLVKIRRQSLLGPKTGSVNI